MNSSRPKGFSSFLGESLPTSSDGIDGEALKLLIANGRLLCQWGQRRGALEVAHAPDLVAAAPQELAADGNQNKPPYPVSTETYAQALQELHASCLADAKHSTGTARGHCLVMANAVSHELAEIVCRDAPAHALAVAVSKSALTFRELRHENVVLDVLIEQSHLVQIKVSLESLATSGHFLGREGWLSHFRAMAQWDPRKISQEVRDALAREGLRELRRHRSSTGSISSSEDASPKKRHAVASLSRDDPTGILAAGESTVKKRSTYLALAAAGTPHATRFAELTQSYSASQQRANHVGSDPIREMNGGTAYRQETRPKDAGTPVASRASRPQGHISTHLAALHVERTRSLRGIS